MSIGKWAIKLSAMKMLAQLLTLLSAMVMSRYLSLSEYGTYSQASLVISLITAVLTLGLPNCMNYFMGRAETKFERKQFLSNFYTMLLAIGIVMGVILSCGLKLIVIYYSNTALYAIWWYFLIYPVASIVVSTAENLFVVYEKDNPLIIFRITHSVVLFSAIVLCNAASAAFETYLGLLLAINIIFAMVVYICAYKYTAGLNIQLCLKVLKPIFAISIPFGVASTVGTLNVELDKLIVARFVSTSVLAIYTNASKEIPISMIAGSFTAIMLPKCAKLSKEHNYKEISKMWGASAGISFILISCLSIGMFTFAPDCIQILYSEKYLKGTSVFRVYCLLMMLRSTYFGLVLNSSGKSREIMRSTVVALLSNCILDLILFKCIGLIGPAIATLISQTVMNGMQLSYTKKIMKIPIRQMFDWKCICEALVLNILLAIVFSIIKNLLPLDLVASSVGESIILGAIWALLYIVLMRNQIKKCWMSLHLD